MRHFVDSSEAQDHNRDNWEKANDLIQTATRGNGLTKRELRTLIEHLADVDELFFRAINDFHLKGEVMTEVDIALRRGGQLQRYALLEDSFEYSDDHTFIAGLDTTGGHLSQLGRASEVIKAVEPSIKIFLKADLPLIRSAFYNDVETARLLSEQPEFYSESPEAAMALQEEWLRLAAKAGRLCISRKFDNKLDFAHQLADRLTPVLNGHLEARRVERCSWPRGILKRKEIEDAIEAATSSGLIYGERRPALFSGLEQQRLRTFEHSIPLDQIRSDLNFLNDSAKLADDHRRLALVNWLDNAGRLAGEREESRLFRSLLSRAEQRVARRRRS